MSVEDYIKPMTELKSGIPPMMLKAILDMGRGSHPVLIDNVHRSYDRLCELIEKALHGDVPTEFEEKAAEYAARLIVDAALMHDRLNLAGVIVGKFPYDYLADRILPKQKQEVEDNG